MCVWHMWPPECLWRSGQLRALRIKLEVVSSHSTCCLASSPESHFLMRKAGMSPSGKPRMLLANSYMHFPFLVHHHPTPKPLGTPQRTHRAEGSRHQIGGENIPAETDTDVRCCHGRVGRREAGR